MKKIIFIVAIVVFVLSGCATRVPVSYQKPAKYDMKNYRNIEVEEVKVSPLYSFMGFNQRVIDLSEESGFTVYGDSQLFIDRSIANHLTNKIEKEIFKETYFSKADEREATGILETTITALELKQYIFGRKEKDDTTKYFLKQSLALAVNFKVKDGKDGKSVYSHNLRESYEKEYLLDPIEGYILFAPSVLPYFKDLADSIANQIASLIQPKRVTSSVA
ncbi:MAG: hypothetical protein WCY53_00900, partial [Sphaerochaetaceae bacterium]